MKKRAKKGEPAAWLLAHVSHRGKPCLLWPFSKARGFGNLQWDGKITYAHTVMCELVNGPSLSLHHRAAHSCGTDACVHPEHVSWELFSQINSGERAKFRGGRTNLLTPKDVQEIRKLGKTKTHDEVAKRFDISRRQAGRIINREVWQDIL